MDWGEFKDPGSHMCLAGTMVASWSLTNTRGGMFEPFYCRNKYFSH